MSKKGQSWKIVRPFDVERMVRPVYFRIEDLNPNRRVAFHTHPWGQLLFSLEGILQAETEQKNYIILPQHALWIPGGLRHQVSTKTGTKFRGLYMDEPLLSLLENRCVVLEVDGLLRELLLAGTALPIEYDENGPDGRLIQVLMDRLVAVKRVNFHLPLPETGGLRKMVEQLLENPADGQTLKDWAIFLNTSERTLGRRFQKELGMGFREWRQRLHVLESLSRLEEGESVTSIALSLGYESLSAYIAMFRRQVGAPPGRYRQETESKSLVVNK